MARPYECELGATVQAGLALQRRVGKAASNGSASMKMSGVDHPSTGRTLIWLRVARQAGGVRYMTTWT